MTDPAPADEKGLPRAPGVEEQRTPGTRASPQDRLQAASASASPQQDQFQEASAPSTPQDQLRAFWNARYAAQEFAYGREPNDFLVEHVHVLPPGQPVLCMADGEGRNGVWLATRGFDVTSVDVAERGLEKAQALAHEAGVKICTVAADLTRYDLDEARWGGIVSIFLHLPRKARRALHERCVRALAPGGVILCEAYGEDQVRYRTGGPPDPRLLARLADLLGEFPGCRILHRYDGVREVNEGRLHHGRAHVIQVIAQKPAS